MKKRVAVLLFQRKNNITLISTIRPRKSQLPEDYSVTTITGELRTGRNPITTMAETLIRCLGISRDQIILECSLGATFYSKGKEYHWYAMELEPSVQVVPNPAEISEHHWNHPAQLIHTMRNMNVGRREMFQWAIAEACKQDKLERKLFPFLDHQQQVLKEVQLLMPSMA
jgi:hypothetical protein